MVDKPIFHDASGRRAAWVSFIGWAAAIVSTLVGAAFIMSLLAVPPVGGIRLPGQLTAIKAQVLEKKAAAPGLVRTAEALAQRARLRRARLVAQRRLRNEKRMRAHPISSTMRPRGDRPLSIAFYPNWRNEEAFPALKYALPRLDALMPTWLNLHGANMTLATAFNARVYGYIRRNKPDTAILPLVQNANLGKWEGAGLARLLADPVRRATLVTELTHYVESHHLQGITVDFEDVPHSAYRDLAVFLRGLHKAFAPHGWTLAQTAPFDDDSWPFATYARLVDYTVLMAYDQHMSADAAGSIAGESW